jgi:hypothetical protein
MMYCDNPSKWIIYANDAALVIAALLVIIVMQKTQHDRFHSRSDARWIRNARRGSFILVALCAAVTMLTDISLLAVFMLILSTIALLLVNVAALDGRHPLTGTRSAEHHAIAFLWEPLRRLISSFHIGHRR